MSRHSPQAAIILLFQFALLTLLVERTPNLVLLAALAGWFWWSGPTHRYWRLLLAALLMGSWSVIVTQGIFYGGVPRTALLRLVPPWAFPWGEPPGLWLYAEGLWHGLAQSLRFDVMILLGAGLLGRHATDELAQGMRALRLPAPVCFLFAVALRFLPDLVDEARSVWIAQRLRGYRPMALTPGGGGGLPAAGRALLLPLVAANLRRADQVAAALYGRGYRPGRDGMGRPAPMSRAERTVCLLGALFLAGLIAALLLTGLHGGGSFSVEWLEWLYYAVENYV